MAMTARSQTARNPPRGPAAKRRGGAGGLRADRDGDVTMGTAVRGRGRIGKSTPPPSASRDRSSRTTRPGARGSLVSGTTRAAILRQAAASGRTTAPRSDLVELKITGWENSKASSDKDGGVSSLIKWMEKKASNRLGSKNKLVKIQKSRQEDTTLFISVHPEDVAALVRMNGYGWAGTSVKIERIDGEVGPTTEDIRAMLKGVLERRYNFESHFLDLSALGQDPDLQKQNVFDKKSTTSKIFPALMKVLELAFDTPAERDAAVTSVSLANNDLADLSPVTTLSFTLPKLQNLDLSSNRFENLKALDNWRKRFYHLSHLILSGNPIEQNEPNYPAEMMKWYPKLRMLNNVEVRTEEEVSKKSTPTELAFPIRPPLFGDQEGIVERFLTTFFAGFDNDRAALVAHYYDDKSDFSYAVNTQAPRDPAATEHTEKQEWDHYIKNSRNLKKISQLPARQNRLFRGPKAIAEILANLPKTAHVDFSDTSKWMVEAHIQPCVPDITGQSPNGVDGFMITVHGEFAELDASGQPKKKRSFDRTFIIGPGTGPSGVRIVNDMLTVRAYGGAQAFEPDHFDGWNAQQPQPQQQPANLDGAPQLPPGVTLPMAEQMVAEMQKQTGMNVQFSKDCLEAAGWDFQKGLETFASVKANLGPEAFVQPI